MISKTGSQGIAIVSINKIGDSIFTLPAVSAVINHYPGERITIITSEYGAEIYKYFYSQCIIVTLKKNMFWSPDWFQIPGTKARRILKAINPEIIFDLTLTHTSALLLLNSKAKQIIGSNIKGSFRGIYSTFSEQRKEPKLVDMYIDAVLPLIPEAVSYKADLNRESERNNGRILIQPFAGWEAKEWGLNKYLTLALKLKDRYDVQFVLESGTLSAEKINEISNLGIKVNLTGNLTELIKLTEECAVMISNDTGCIYLAAELGKATYTIYGPTNPSYHLPEGTRHGYIQKLIKCSPIKDKYCFTQGGLTCPSFQCMLQLSVNEVIQDVERFLKKNNISILNQNSYKRIN